MFQHGRPSLFKGSYGLLATNGREIVQELVERVPALEVVDEGTEWNSRADENRRSAQDLRIDVNHR